MKLPGKNTAVFFSIFMILPILSSSIFGFEWFLSKHANGIKIFTRKKKDSTLKEFKAITEVDGSLEEVVAFMKRIDNYVNWFDAVSEVELLEKVSDDEYYIYVNNTAPWPVKDRDNISRMEFVQEGPDVVKVYVTGVPDYMPKHKKRVRVPYIKGFWQFKKISANKTEVTEQMHASPGGSIPNWLANMVVVDNPFNTLKSMKKAFE